MKKKQIIPFIITLLFMIALLTFAIVQMKQARTISVNGYYFNTYITITAYESNDDLALNDCLKMCEHYENLFSRTIEGSDIYRINNSNGNEVLVDEETYYLLQESIKFCEETNGAIDITVADIMDLWGFTDISKPNTLPDSSKLDECLSHVDYRNLEFLGDCKVKLKDPASHIDLGFIAKGYIADKLKDYLIERGIKKAIISLGGNIYVIGSKTDDKGFNIGIKNPAGGSEIIDKLEVKDSSVVTSGTYERYIEVNGKKYHHILDTSNGYPVDNDINGVTIICDSSMYADALSTTCLILGEDKSKEILQKYNAKAIFY